MRHNFFQNMSYTFLLERTEIFWDIIVRIKSIIKYIEIQLQKRKTTMNNDGSDQIFRHVCVYIFHTHDQNKYVPNRICCDFHYLEITKCWMNMVTHSAFCNLASNWDNDFSEMSRDFTLFLIRMLGKMI